MMPWGHLAVGYLLYTAYTHLLRRRSPDGWPTLALAVGTQLPDLIDKPLAYWLEVIEGRALGHSVLFLVPVCAIVLVGTHRRDRGALGIAFALGALSHLLGDTIVDLLSSSSYGVSYLLWPALPSPQYGVTSFAHHLDQLHRFAGYVLEQPSEVLLHSFFVEIILVLVVLFVWALDRFPGLDVVLYAARAGVAGFRP